MTKQKWEVVTAVVVAVVLFNLVVVRPNSTTADYVHVSIPQSAFSSWICSFCRFRQLTRRHAAAEHRRHVASSSLRRRSRQLSLADRQGVSCLQSTVTADSQQQHFQKPQTKTAY